jgi:carbamoyl-phosphate synthase large subunit
MEKKAVLVTGVGGNVGQGILRNIISMNLQIRLIGIDIAPFTSGNHLCDQFYQVPYSYHENFIESLENIIKKESIDLILPSTDYEVFYLAKNISKLNTSIVVSNFEQAKIFLDKYETFLYLTRNNIAFAKSWKVNEYDFSDKEIIAKPREGRGSQGIILNPENPKELPSNYLIQSYIRGIEITTAVYVTKAGLLHGLFTLERSLTNGTTTKAKVIFDHDEKIRKIAQAIIDLGGMRGSFNIQSIVNTSGEVIPFEINCRISGTNSIRHQLGFPDVKFAIQEYLLNQNPDRFTPIRGVATRILMDVIYPDCTDFEDQNKATPHLVY